MSSRRDWESRHPHSQDHMVISPVCTISAQKHNCWVISLQVNILIIRILHVEQANLQTSRKHANQLSILSLLDSTGIIKSIFLTFIGVSDVECECCECWYILCFLCRVEFLKRCMGKVFSAFFEQLFASYPWTNLGHGNICLVGEIKWNEIFVFRI